MDPQALTAESTTVEHDLIEVDSLVEEVSIDGMCGVY
ncbi:mycofactocin precursor MftA [Microbacterium sp.]|jgi:mycofactocin precursor|nr:mycofactocin precursor MftA [Microbacterium sp.]